MPLSEILVLISSYLLLLLLLAGELAIFLIARIYPFFSVFLALNVRFLDVHIHVLMKPSVTYTNWRYYPVHNSRTPNSFSMYFKRVKTTLD